MAPAVMLVAIIVFGLTTVVSVARAQVVSPIPNQTLTSTGYTVSFAHPTVADGGIINCTYGTTPNCRPFNKAACSEGGLPIDISVLSVGAAQVPFINTYGYAWLQSNNATCYCGNDGSCPSPTDPNAALATTSAILLGKTRTYLPISSTFFTGGTVAFDLPNSVDAPADINTNSIINTFAAACDPNQGINLTVWTLCLGADASGNGFVGTPPSGTINQVKDPIAFFQFPVDTVPPATPTNLSAFSLVEDVTISGNYDTTAGEVQAITILYTDDPDNVANTDCTTWNTNVQSVGVDVDTTGNFSQDIAGTNGVTYAYCAQAIDFLGNPSTPTAPVTAAPHTECDFFGCYPVALQVGYCGAGLTPGWAAGMIGLFGACRAARRRRSAGLES